MVPSRMLINTPASDRVERFLDAHPTGPLVVCVGSASVAGIVWLAQRCESRPVTLLVGDMKSRNFAKATDSDRRAALRFVQRSSVRVLNWYRTGRSSQGRSEAHLKVWAACDDTGAPRAFLIGSANLTIAGLHENVELMALADASDFDYLRRSLAQLQREAWDDKERLQELIGHDDFPTDRHHPHGRGHAQPAAEHNPWASPARTGCGPQLLAALSLVAVGAVVVVRCSLRYRRSA